MVKSETCVIWKSSEYLAIIYLRKLSLLKLPLPLTSPEAVGQSLNSFFLGGGGAHHTAPGIRHMGY